MPIILGLVGFGVALLLGAVDVVANAPLQGKILLGLVGLGVVASWIQNYRGDGRG